MWNGGRDKICGIWSKHWVYKLVMKIQVLRAKKNYLDNLLTMDWLIQLFHLKTWKSNCI